MRAMRTIIVCQLVFLSACSVDTDGYTFVSMDDTGSGTSSETAVVTGSDSNSSTITDTPPTDGIDSSSDSHTGANFYSDTSSALSDGDSDTDSEADSEGATDSDTEFDSDTDTITATGADTATLIDSATDTGTVTEIAADSVTDPGIDTQSDSGTDTGASIGTDSEADSETDSETDTDTALPQDCAGLSDFTPCDVTTSPDREYDICIRGVCQSPGCGTADCNVPGPYFTLADSGQRTCFDDAGALSSCPASGDSYYGQDAQYGWDVTHDASLRYTRIITAGEPIVEDNVTGLVWQGCPAGLSGGACTDGSGVSLIWSEALAYCDALSWGGHDDWRLPDEFALQSIMDYGVSAPSVDEEAFPETVSNSSWYWTSSTSASDENKAKLLIFYYGYIVGADKAEHHATLCVRGAAFSAKRTRFERGGDLPIEPTVTDFHTGLMWQGCTSGKSGEACGTGAVWQMTWEEALAYCVDLSWGGNNDWRLPSIVELQSITDNSVAGSAIDESVFPETNTDNLYWSSTSYVASNYRVWSLFFESSSFSDISMGSSLNVRCVRSDS